MIPDLSFCISYDLLQPQICFVGLLYIHIIHGLIQILLFPKRLIQLPSQPFQLCVCSIRPRIQRMIFHLLNPFPYQIHPHSHPV